MNLIHCIYASRAKVDTRETQIEALLDRARHNNLAHDITGMLLFVEGSFFQVLEGDAEAVGRTFDLITRDSRHDRIVQIIREPIAQRSFGEWSMGFESVARADLQRFVGANDFFGSADCLETINPGRAKKLLVAFGAGRWRTDETGRHRTRARVDSAR